MKFEFEVVERYTTGLAKSYRLPNGFTWNWDDWILIRIQFHNDNHSHLSLASSFREAGSEMTCTIVNPNYERVYDLERISKFSMFGMIRVLKPGSER